MRYARYRSSPVVAGVPPALWRLAGGVVTALCAVVLWLGFVTLTVMVFEGVPPERALGRIFGLGADGPAGATVALLLVAGLGFGTLAAARLWQRRRLGGIAGRGARVLRDFAVAAGVTLAVILGVAAVTLPGQGEVVANLDPAVWAAWLPLGLAAVALQTGSEELFFRGYLQSQLAARFAAPAVWLTIPAIAFGLAHYAPGIPVGVAWAYVAFATGFGLIAGDLTARTGSLGAAWGLHFANNAFAVLIVATEGTVSGLGLFVTRDTLAAVDPLDPMLLLDVLPLLFVWWLLRRLLAR